MCCIIPSAKIFKRRERKVFLRCYFKFQGFQGKKPIKPDSSQIQKCYHFGSECVKSVCNIYHSCHIITLGRGRPRIKDKSLCTIVQENNLLTVGMKLCLTSSLKKQSFGSRHNILCLLGLPMGKINMSHHT